MSLIDEFMQDCRIMDMRTVSDGEGGYDTEWLEGANIKCAIVHDSSMQAKIAEKQGVTSVYTITTQKGVDLPYHTVIKRLSDGAIFRVTSNSGEKVTPASSSLNMAQVSAEKWELTA